MKQFFIIKDNQNVGPMTPDQLVQFGLQPNSLVWTEGMAEWMPASQVPELMPYLGQAQPAAPAQPQQPYQQPYQQPAQQQPYQQPYQQPAQQPYQQPYQQPAQQPGQPVQSPFANMTPQGIFKIILYIILAYTAISGLIYFIHSFSTMKLHKGTGPGVFELFIGLVVIGICVVTILRMVKNERYAFLALGFFAITFLFALLNLIIVAPVYTFIMLLIASILGIVCTIFSIMPMEKLGDPNSYKSILTEATQLDYILLGAYAVLSLAFLLFTCIGKLKYK